MTDSPLQPGWYDPKGPREGRYALGPLLGQGGMGEVYEAWDTVLARPLALKILRRLDPAGMIRFMQEAQLHARLDCPNICRIYDVDAGGGVPRIAMQLVRGPNLEDASPELSLEEILDILITVTDAVHAAHQQKLIHRDIKPSNILLQWKENGGWAPYLCDFGLAMSLEGPSVTQPLAMTGTPAYMAPEQVRGDRSLICPATDVYGIGSTLYFTLTGRPPCVSTVTAEVLRVKRERRFPSPRALEPAIPPDLEGILLKCLQPEPAHRYETAAELAEDLRRFQAGHPPHALAPSPHGNPSKGRGRFRKVLGFLRKRGPWAACAALLALLALGLGAGELRLRRNLRWRADLGHSFLLEAINLEREIVRERALETPDLSAAYARVRARLPALKERAARLGPEAAGPMHHALGRTLYLLRDYRAAESELEHAWADGFRPPECGELLARIHCLERIGLLDEADFAGQAPPALADALLGQAEQDFRESRSLSLLPPTFPDALLAFARRDLSRATDLARAALEVREGHPESAVLASLSLSAMASAQARGGDPSNARTTYQDALEILRIPMARGSRMEELLHAKTLASQGTAWLDLEERGIAPETLAALRDQADRHLHMAPEDPGFQSDWLRARILEIQDSASRGLDPRKALDEALRFLWTQTREPWTVALRVDHMTLYGLLAELDAAQGRDPGPALAQALKIPGHGVGLHRDPLGRILVLQARLQAGRGQDPRPVLARVLQPSGGPGNALTRPDPETAAEALLLQGEWESAAGLEAGPTLQRAQSLLQEALRTHPASASAHLLLGLSQALEARTQPARRNWLASQAQEQLRRATQLKSSGPRIALLKRCLARLIPV